MKKLLAVVLLLASSLWPVSEGTSAGWLPLVSAGGGCNSTFPTLTNLVGHWRADVGVTTSSGNVTDVAPQNGGQGVHLVNNGTVPLAATGSIHGQPAFNLLAANTASLKNTTALDFSAQNNLSIFIVGQMLTGTGSSGGLATQISSINDFADTGGFFFGRDSTTNNIWAGQGGAAFTSDQVVSLATQYRMGLIVTGSTSTQIFLNNVAGPTGGAGFTGNVNSFMSIGSRILSGTYAGNYWEGPISDIVITNSALSSTERNNLDTYFTCVWGT